MRFSRSTFVSRFAFSMMAVVATSRVATHCDAGFQADGITLVGSQVQGGPNAPLASYTAGYSSYGDHASGVLNFNLPGGIATVTTHACSGPTNPIDPGGGAKGDAIQDSIIFAYQITSKTLPTGTPVNVKVCVAGAKSGNASYTYPDGGAVLFDFADAAVGVTINVAGVSFSGSAYMADYAGADGSEDSASGLFGGENEMSAMIPMKVGDTFSIYLNYVSTSRSKAAYQTLADGNCQSTVLWGAAVVDADAQIVSYDDGSLFPTLGQCTYENAVKQIPPPPALGPCHLGLCPEGYYCYTPEGQCDTGEPGDGGAPGQCQVIPTECTEVDPPVCGCDGNDYANLCDAAAAGVSVQHTGPCGSPKPAPEDINEDGVVDGADLGLLLGSWGDCPPPPPRRNQGNGGNRGGLAGNPVPACPGDINDDGVVDGSDLGLLLGAWTG